MEALVCFKGFVLSLLATLRCQANFPQNLALWKPTYQSGTYPDFKYKGFSHQGNSSFAVDGNTRIDAENMTCTRSEYYNITWWMVDLQDAYPIREVAILSPPELRVVNFTIETALYWNEIEDKLVNPRICYQQLDPMEKGLFQTFPCGSLDMGRYVRITKYRRYEARLALCQVEVYGSTVDRLYSLTSRPGKRSRNQRIRTTISRSPLLCSAECRQYPECTSFNMEDKGGVCELISDPVHGANENEEDVTGWTRYTMIP